MPLRGTAAPGSGPPTKTEEELLTREDALLGDKAEHHPKVDVEGDPSASNGTEHSANGKQVGCSAAVLHTGVLTAAATGSMLAPLRHALAISRSMLVCAFLVGKVPNTSACTSSSDQSAFRLVHLHHGVRLFTLCIHAKCRHVQDSLVYGNSGAAGSAVGLSVPASVFALLSMTHLGTVTFAAG